MAPIVDYSALSRRELQALCKQHKIPANKTNVFMAESLDALLNNAPRKQEEFQEDEAPAPDSPEVENVVAKVKGKRAPKKALLQETELDSLAGLLANSSLNSDVQEEMIVTETEEPEKTEDPVPSENFLPLAPLVVVPKGRRGRPRITKKEEQIVQAIIAHTVEIDENMVAADADLIVTETPEEVTTGAEDLPDTLTHEAIVSAREEPQAERTPIVFTRTKKLARTKKEVPIKTVAAEVQAVVTKEEVAPVGVSEPETEMIETMEGQHFSSLPLVEEAEDRVRAPTALRTKLKKAGSHRTAETRIEVDVEDSGDAPESHSVPADIEPEMEEIALPPVEEKKSKKKKGSKSRRNAKVEVEVEIMVEEQAETKDEVLQSAEPIDESDEAKDIAVGGNDFSWTSPPSVLEEEELGPVKQISSTREKPKARKKTKGSHKHRKNAEQVPAAVVEDNICENAEDEPADVGDFVSTRPATAMVEVDCENSEDEPAEVCDFVSTRHARAAMVEVEDEDQMEEPVTPVKKTGSNNVADDKENDKEALLSLSMRKLVKKCKEKGLRTRGANNTRSVKL